MDKLLIRGGAPLRGTVSVSGSKNASLPILAAALLTRERVVVRRVPDVSDTNYMLQILRALGAHVERASGTVVIEAGDIQPEAPYDLVRKMRASICVMGPLVARLGRASVSLPGGCVIGDRPVDLHLKGLAELGADVTVKGGNIVIDAARGLAGREVNMAGAHGPTVLGTGNLMMAAVLAEGTTVIENAAAEPEVADLAGFLRSLGADIEGEGTPRVVVHGVPDLHGADYTVIPDRIEAGTFLVAGALAGGPVRLRRARPDHLTAVLDRLVECGHEVSSGDGWIEVRRGQKPVGCEITTAPYPGFPTDMQAQMCALFATTPGISVVTEAVFPQRFMHLAELKRMGAEVRIEGSTAIIHGVDRLEAAPVMASDLRASAALLLAALTTEGTTEVRRVYHIDRGYEHIDDKFAELGADIRRVREG